MSDDAKFTSADEPSPTEYEHAEFPLEIPEESLADELPDSVTFEVMAFGGQSTVCATAPEQTERSTAYQSEAQLEDAFIKQLEGQGYDYLSLSSEDELVANLRAQLEKLNDVAFTDDEWSRLLKGYIASENDGIAEKTRRIQRDHVSTPYGATTAA